MSYHLYPASDGKHKYEVVTPEGKTVKFGAKGYSDYTIHKDSDRKQRYIGRHKKNENWRDLHKAGTWSRYILWGEPTLRSSISSMNHKFGIHIVLHNTSSKRSPKRSPKRNSTKRSPKRNSTKRSPKKRSAYKK